MQKYSEELKLAAIHTYRAGQLGWKAAAKVHNVEPSSLRKWVAAYEVHGIDGIRRKNIRQYSEAFKLEVLQRMRDEALSYRQVAALFNIRPSPFEPRTLTARKISAEARIGPAEIAYAFDTATEFAPLTPICKRSKLRGEFVFLIQSQDHQYPHQAPLMPSKSQERRSRFQCSDKASCQFWPP